MTLQIAKYERLARVFHKPKYLPTPVWAVVDDLFANLYQAKRIFVFENKSILGLQEHDYCSDCGVDFHNPREGECTENCMCEYPEGDCRSNHIQDADGRCGCEYCIDAVRDHADSLRKAEQERN